MPGILPHATFAELIRKAVLKQLWRKLIKFDIHASTTLFALFRILQHPDFLAGNLIPDLATDKKASHYRISASVDGFVVPDMEKVKNDLFFPDTPVKFGCFCHLWLDYHFIEELLIPSFIWDANNNKVINPRNQKTWDPAVFFSQDGLYGAYTEMNQLMIRSGHVPLVKMDKLPDLLPPTGLTVFDTRKKVTWREELNAYLSTNKKYTGDVFEYEYFWNCIETLSSKFVEEICTSLHCW